MKVDTPQIGDVGMVRITGLTGWLIDLGQRLNRSEKQYAKFEHVMLCTGVDWALEGQPGGAVMTRVSQRYPGREVVWVRPVPALTGEQMDRIVGEAQRLIGTPYSFLDYAALAVKRFKIPFPGLEKYIVSTKHMICSQIIVEVYRGAGLELFSDVPSGYVTPADFAKEFIDAP